MSLNDNNVGIEKPDGKCSISLVAEGFSKLFLHPSISFIIDLNGVLLEFRF